MWKNKLDKEGYVCGMFNNLSKVFDTLNHNLLIAKLETCGFKRESLSFMKSYIRFMSIRIFVLGKRSLQE